MSDSYKRRPVNNNNDNNNGFEGIQIPPTSAAGYQPLRSSAETAKPIGQPYTQLDSQGRTWFNATCYGITIAIFIVLLAVGCVVTGVIVWHRAQEHVETKRCGDITIPESSLCVDVIIGGCGTAGSTAAREISADPSLSVLCIEEGPDWYNLTEVLTIGNFLAYFQSLDGPVANKFYYDYHTTYETGLLGVGPLGPTPGRIHIRGGRGLGGSASFNYMFTFKNVESFWDDWDTIGGSSGTWSGAAMYQVMKELEHFNDHGQYIPDATRGDGSLPTQTWKVDLYPGYSIVGTDQEALMKLIGGSLGLPEYPDSAYNTLGNRLGVYPHIELLRDFDTTSPRLRWSARASFLGPDVMNQATNRGVSPRQLAVEINSTVFDLVSVPTPNGPKFVGVRYKASDGNVKTAYARHTVVATFGVNTAPILQRSGVGPADVLAFANVQPVIVNEHVGQHLTLHLSPIVFAAWPNITSSTYGDPDHIGINAIVLAAEDLSEAAAVPGRESFAMFSFTLGFPGLFLLGGQWATPKSEGSIRIHSKDPFHLPQITTNTLTNPDDMVSLRNFTRNLVYSVQAYDPSVFIIAPDGPTLADDALLDGFFRATITIPDHYYSTCRMSQTAATGVVDNRFRVHGAAGGSLRVCDLQSLPYQSFGNPYAVAIALGSQCGRMVVEEFGSAAAKKELPVRRATAKNDLKHGRRHSTSTKTSRAPPTHAGKAMTDEEMWDMYQHAIEVAIEKLDRERAAKIVTAIKGSPEYKRLEAIYGTTSKKNTKTA